MGLGLSLVRALGCEVQGLKVFPGNTGVGSTCLRRRGIVVLAKTEMTVANRSSGSRDVQSVTPALQLQQTIDGFRYKSGYDLSGYEDGTENPKGAAA